MTASPQAPWASLQALRAARPIVHNITNLVAMDLTANLLLAAGASPAMANAVDEVAEIVARANVLAVNIGTPTRPQSEAMALAAGAARDRGLPWVLDPVGVGMSGFRGAIADRLLAIGPTVVRGNSGEILHLAGEAGDGGGIDSSLDSAAALDAAHRLARRTGAVVAVTGAVDLVTDGRRDVRIANGDPLMTRVSGLGCALSALVGACLAVTPEPLAAAAHALALVGVAGQRAAAAGGGPGSLRLRLLDELYSLDEATLNTEARIT